MHTGYIDDGYTRDGYFKPLAGVHGEVRFTYRPTLATDRAVYLKAVRSDAPEVLMVKTAKLLARQIKEWSVTDSKGSPVPISEAAILRLDGRLLDRMADVVGGFAVGDADPNAPAEESAELAAAKGLLMESGATAAEAAEAKN